MTLPDDYTIRTVDLPPAVGGFMSECPDGHVDVYINARWGHWAQQDAAKHEFDHWRNGDLYNGLDIREVERRKKAKLDAIPRLMRARDLLPRKTRRIRPMTRREARVLARCIGELDRIMGWEEY